MTTDLEAAAIGEAHHGTETTGTWIAFASTVASGSDHLP